MHLYTEGKNVFRECPKLVMLFALGSLAQQSWHQVSYIYTYTNLYRAQEVRIGGVDRFAC